MVGPEQAVMRIVQAQQREPHRRRTLERELTPPVGFEVGIEPCLLLGGSELTPVEMCPGHIDAAMDFLPAFALDTKGRSQDRMSLDDSLPGALEMRRLERLAQVADRVLHVGPGAWRRHAVDQHVALHRREPIRILDVRVARGPHRLSHPAASCGVLDRSGWDNDRPAHSRGTVFPDGRSTRS